MNREEFKTIYSVARTRWSRPVALFMTLIMGDRIVALYKGLRVAKGRPPL